MALASLNLETAQEDRFILLDAGSVIYPAYHVLKNLSTRDGFPTGAIFGFTRTLIKVLREYPSRYMAIAFDARGATVRHERYEEYKAHRPRMEDDLAVQIPRIKELIEAFNIPTLEAPGYEADDLIAALTEQGQRQEFEVLIVSGDKDLMQLVGNGVKILKPSRKPGAGFRLMDRAGVEDYLGVPPRKIRDYLALVGDSVDNVPGVPGIGEVTARKLIQKHDSFERIFEDVDAVEDKRARKALREHRDQARLSYDLVQLEMAPLDAPLESFRIGEPSWPKVKEIFTELEFRSMIEELDLHAEEMAGPQQEIERHVITDEEALENLCRRLAQSEEVSLDLETTSENDMEAKIVGIALSFQPYEGFYIPVDHDDTGRAGQLPLGAVLQKLRPYLEGDDLGIIGQNLKYDAKVLRRAGVQLENIAFDSMIAAYLLDPMGRKDLNELGLRYLGHGVRSFKDLNVERMSALAIEDAAEYAIADAETVVRLKEAILPEIESKNLGKLLSEVELPLIPVLVEMELNGITLDPDVLQEQEKELQVHLDRIRGELFDLAGQEFNPNSPKQVAEILFEVLKLPVIKRTKTGPSTDAMVLQELAPKHPLPEKLLIYREWDKLLGTYVRALPEHVHPETGRIHTSFNQSVTTTGRLSSSEPNLQNIPIRSEVGGQIRKAFVAPPGRKLIGADYSQIELRILADISGDPGLIEAFEGNEDIHARTAASILGIPIEEVTEQQRDLAKRVNFGLAYGMSAFGLSQWAKISRSEAEEFIESYFESYPGVKAYMDRVVDQAEQQGYVETPLGRRRSFGSLDSRAKREAINMPIQGMAADLMKLAMIQVHELIQSAELQADMLLQIHDELILEADEDQAEESARIVKRTMEGAMELKVPIVAELKVGQNWGEI